MGAAHAKAGEPEAAEAAYSKAQTACASLIKDQQGTDGTNAQRRDNLRGCMELTLDRLANAWKLHHTVSDSVTVQKHQDGRDLAGKPAYVACLRCAYNGVSLSSNNRRLSFRQSISGKTGCWILAPDNTEATPLLHTAGPGIRSPVPGNGDA